MSDKDEAAAALLREIEDLRGRLAELEASRQARQPADAATVAATAAALDERVGDMSEPEHFFVYIFSLVMDQMLRLGVPLDGGSVQIVNEAADDFLAMGRGVPPLGDPGYPLWSAFLDQGPAWRRMTDHVDLYPWVVEVWRSGATRYQPRFAADWDPGRTLSLADAPFAGGTLAINSRRPDAFAPRDIDLLERFAALLDKPFARFLELVAEKRFARQREDEAEIRAAVDELRQVVWHMAEPEDLLLGVISVMWEKLRLLGVTFHSFGWQIVNEAGDDFIGIGRFIPNLDGDVDPSWTTLLASGRSWSRRSDNAAGYPWVVEAWRTGEPRFTCFAAGQSPFNGVLSVLDVPCAYGTLAVNSREPGAYGARDVAVLRSLAPVVDQAFARFLDLAAARRRQRRDEVLQRARAAIGGMRGSGDIDRVMAVVREGLLEIDVPFAAGGANVVAAGDPPSVRIFEIARDDPHSYWIELVVPAAAAVIVAMWRNQEVAYRKDLAADDPYGEREWLGQARCVLDVPFSHGTLSINGHTPAAFTDEHVEMMREIAAALSEGFTRMDDLRALEEQNRLLQREAAERERVEAELRHAQKLEVVGQLTAGVAHNFNNKLMGVIFILEGAMEKEQGPLRGQLETAHRAAREAADIVAQLMTYSRKDADAEYRPVPVDGLIDRVTRLCRETFDRKILVASRPSPRTPSVRANANQLEQVLLNICLNARDALAEVADRAPALELSAETVTREGGLFARIAVADNGVGMDETTRERIFDPFFTTKDVGAGTGLGLSTAFGIVRQHQGWIECESEPGAGTTFAVYLPVTSEREGAATSEPASAGGGGKVLIIDDEEIVASALQRAMERGGYETRTAGGGVEGVEWFRRERPDLVLLDLSMPVMSGREVLRELRALDPGVPVIVVTGFPGEEIAGVAAVLQKPVDVAELLAAAAAALKD